MFSESASLGKSLPAFKNIRQISLISQLVFTLVIFGRFRWFQVGLDGFRLFLVVPHFSKYPIVGGWYKELKVKEFCFFDYIELL